MPDSLQLHLHGYGLQLAIPSDFFDDPKRLNQLRHVSPELVRDELYNPGKT